MPNLKDFIDNMVMVVLPNGQIASGPLEFIQNQFVFGGQLILPEEKVKQVFKIEADINTNAARAAIWFIETPYQKQS